jgi:hypothetical protein
MLKSDATLGGGGDLVGLVWAKAAGIVAARIAAKAKPCNRLDVLNRRSRTIGGTHIGFGRFASIDV